SGGQTTAFAQTKFGTQKLIRPISPNNALSPGEFYTIDVSGTGGSSYGNDILYGSPNQIACRSSYSLRTGNITGQTRSNVQTLIGDPPDTFVATGQYRRFDGTVRDRSKSLVLAPVAGLASIPGFCPGTTIHGTHVDSDVV